MSMSWRRIGWVVLVVVCGHAPLAAAPPPLQAGLGADRFVVGCPVRVDRAAVGDAFAAGCSVDVDSAVAGDALVAGGNVRLGAPVGQSLFAAAGQLTVNASIGRNARLAGGQIAIGSGSRVAGNVLVAGGDVRIDGAVKGSVRAAAGRLRIDGPVDGDVVATAGTVELGPKARIAGQLRYASREDLVRDAAAQVQGGVQRMPWAEERQGPPPAARAVAGGGAGWVWSAGLMAIAAVLAAAWPGLPGGLAVTLRTRAGLSLLLGFVALVCIPVAALILMFTLIGVPMGLLAIVLYLALLLVGYVSAGIGLGAWVLARVRGTRSTGSGWRIGAAALGVLAVALLGRLPYVGWIVVVLALLAGIGAVLLQARARPAGP